MSVSCIITLPAKVALPAASKVNLAASLVINTKSSLDVVPKYAGPSVDW